MSEKTKSVTDLRALGSWILTRLRTIKWKQFIFGYGQAVASAALTVGLVLLLRHYSLRISLTLLVVAALIGTTWYGGLGPGLVLSVLLEIATVALTTAPPRGAGAIFTQFSGFGLLVILVILVYTQKRAQMRWRESAEWLRVTLSSIGDAVIATDLNGVVTFMNPVAEALTGCSRDELIGQVIDNLNAVMGSFGGQNRQFAKAVDSLSELIKGLAAHKTEISNAVAYTNAASATIADLLSQARPPFKNTVAQTDRVASLVAADRDSFDDFLNILPENHHAMARLGLYGGFWSFYLCDLLLKVNGKGGQPVYVKLAGQDTGRCAPK